MVVNMDMDGSKFEGRGGIVLIGKMVQMSIEIICENGI